MVTPNRTHPRARPTPATLVLLGLLAVCGGNPAVTPSLFASAERTGFWEPPSTDFEGRELLMHARECSADQIRVPSEPLGFALIGS